MTTKPKASLTSRLGISTRRASARIALLLSLFHGPGLAEVTVKQVKEAGKSEIDMENPFVRLSVDLLHGARVTGFVHKATGHQWIDSGQGLFADHVWQQSWPGELYSVPYEARVEKTGPEEGIVTVWRVIEGAGQTDIAGVRVERTLRLSDDSPAVEVTIKLTNTTDGPRSVGYWSQHILNLGGPSDNFYLRPSARGLSVGEKVYRDGGRQQSWLGEEWVKDPVAGWSAAVNPMTGEAAVFVMDYNDLRWLYNCISSWTVEWYYDLLRMTPGREWTTNLMLLPLKGYKGVTYASKELIADLSFQRKGAGFTMLYNLGAGVRPVANVQLETELVSLPGRPTLARESKRVGALTFSPQQIASGLDLARARGDFLVRVHVSGDGLDHTFERSFSRKALSDHLIAEYPSARYLIPRPVKKKSLPRPSVLKLSPHNGFTVLELRGMFYPHWRIAQALGRGGPHRVQPAHFVTNVYGDRLDYFPAGYDEMLGYDVVVLEDIPVEAIGEEGLALLKDYVEAGGGLLVCGGWHSFAGGGYVGSGLEDVLPVTIGPSPDLHWHAQGLSLKADQRFLPVTLSSFAYWCQEIKGRKADSTVIVTAGDKPFLVTSTYRKGRVACLLGAPCGSPQPGQTGFWEDDHWTELLGQTLR
ncbi:MAG: hypothetical protein HY318_07115 [Armatimonadetes bacterium]|nr:hypothetical protein [Armatimonadota bacterium]